MKDIISIQDVWFSYPNGVEALKGINLTFQEGGITALIGQNGSGKTTLAKLTNGLLKPTKGKVTVEGMETTDKHPYELAQYVGYAFQNPARQLYTSSVEAELLAGPLNLGVGQEEAKSRVNAAMDLFGLKGLESQRPSMLPFPLKKTVCLASVYTMQPKVMLLDEPTTGQDHVGIRTVQRIIQKIRDAGITVIIITHDMRLVAESAERVITMALGKIIKVGTPVEIFLDEEAMNAAALRPPQILELSSQLDAEIPNHGGPSCMVEDEVFKLRSLIGGHQ